MLVETDFRLEVRFFFTNYDEYENYHLISHAFLKQTDFGHTYPDFARLSLPKPDKRIASIEDEHGFVGLTRMF